MVKKERDFILEKVFNTMKLDDFIYYEYNKETRKLIKPDLTTK